MEFYSANLNKVVNGIKSKQDNNQVIIVADDKFEATVKLAKCIKKLNNNELNLKRHIVYTLIDDIKPCCGIFIADGLDDYTYHYGLEDDSIN